MEQSIFEKEIKKQLEEKIKKIDAIEYHYDLFELFSTLKNLSPDKKNSIYENLINYYLENIKSKDIITIENIEDKKEEIMDFFYYNYNLERNENKSIYMYLEAESSDIVNDLVSKSLKENNRNLNLPIRLQFIKEFCISSKVDESDTEKVILFIILELSIIYYLTNK